MPKLTLLELTQDILNDLESDEVNTISATVESMQIAQIIKTTYYNIVEGSHYPHRYELFQFDALGDVTKPNYLQIPDGIISIEWIKYNTKKVTDTKNIFTELVYKEPEDFLSLVDARDSSASNVTVVSDFSGVPLNILTDKAPQYYTSFDDTYIILDSYDSVVDTTVQNSKSSGRGRRDVTFTLEDSFVPDMPVQMFPYLLNEAKSTAFLILKQSANPKAEQHSISQRRNMSQDAFRIKKGIKYPSYGRK